MMKLRNSLKNQSGFTLVEIAIVMVIIGLLIGGVLKGQEMIKNAKVKRVMKQADELRAAVYSYQDRYGQIPGDDNAPVVHTGVAGLTAGGNNGQISAAEDQHVFAHLAAANLISGDPATYGTGTLPQNAFGGTMTVLWAGVQGKTTNWIQFSNVPTDVARMIDLSVDDGVYNTGSVRASTNYNNNDVILTLSTELF